MSTRLNGPQTNRSSIVRYVNSIIPTAEVPERHRRFDQFVAGIDAILPQTSPQVGLMICLITFEQIRSRDDLLRMLEALSAAYVSTDAVYVDWTDMAGKTQRRKLSSRSIIALDRAKAFPTDWREQFIELSRALGKHYPAGPTWLTKDVLDMVFLDSTGWAYFVLPRFCVALLEGFSSSGLLPRHRLAAVRSPSINQLSNFEPDSDLMVEGWHASMELMYPQVDRKAYGSYCLDDLKSVFSHSGSDGSLRVRDWRERAQITHRVNLVAHHVLEKGTPVDGLLLGWICHLLSSGSVKLRNPAAGTISDYFRTIAPRVIRAFSLVQCGPSDLTDDGWQCLFDQMHAGLPSSEHAGFCSLYLFCVDSFGLSVSPALLGTDPQLMTPRAADISEREFLSCLALAPSQTRDKRMVATIEAILALGWGCAPRIMEVWGLHIEDLVIHASFIEVFFMPHANEHEGKSRAARRCMRIDDPIAVRILSDFKERRLQEGALPSDILFGDPYQAHKPYLLGACTRVVNHLLKVLCHDDSASFHDFRHAWVNRQVLNQVQDCESSVTFDELRVRLGHAPLSDTFLTSYFCHQADAIRISIDKYLFRSPLRSTAASFWTGKKAAALRVAKRRATDRHKHYWNEITERAQSICIKSAAASTAITAPASIPPRLNLDLNVVRKFLRDVQSGLSLDSLRFRLGLDDQSLSQLLSASQLAMGLLRDSFVPRATQLPADEAGMRECREGLTTTGFDFSLSVEPTLAPAWNALADKPHPSPELALAIQGWAYAWTGSYLSLVRPSQVVPLLKLMKAWGVNDSAFQIRYTCDDAKDTHVRAVALSSSVVQSALVTVSSVIRQRTPPMPVGCGKGTPAVYLITKRQVARDNNDRFAPASCRSARLNGFLFGVLVWSFISEAGSM